MENIFDFFSPRIEREKLEGKICKGPQGVVKFVL